MNKITKLSNYCITENVTDVPKITLISEKKRVINAMFLIYRNSAVHSRQTVKISKLQVTDVH